MKLPPAPISPAKRAQLKADCASLEAIKATAARKSLTLDAFEARRELAVAQQHFEFGCWLHHYSSRVYGTDNRADRVECARLCLEAGMGRSGYEFYVVFDFGERHFDTCFEMGDGVEVKAALSALAAKDPGGALARAFPAMGWAVPVAASAMNSEPEGMRQMSTADQQAALSHAAIDVLNGASFVVGYFGTPPRENSMVGVVAPVNGRMVGVDGRGYDGITRHEPFDASVHHDLVEIAAYGIRRMFDKERRALSDTFAALDGTSLAEAVAQAAVVSGEQVSTLRNWYLNRPGVGRTLPESQPERYRVVWEIDSNAVEPEDAAREAWESLRAVDSSASVFTVVGRDGSATTVDLDALDAEAGMAP